MGHSIAGVYIRAYAAWYPQQLSGLIFVDGSTPLQEERPAFKAVGVSAPPVTAFSSELPRSGFHGDRQVLIRVHVLWPFDDGTGTICVPASGRHSQSDVWPH